MLKQGRPLVFIFAVVSVVVWLLTFKFGSLYYYILTILFSGITLLLINFFRDPQRKIEKDNSVLYSPADGKIFDIEETPTTYCVKIFMSIFDVHIQRSPLDCVVEKVEYTKGKFYPAGKDKTELYNEKNTIILRDKEGSEFKVTQITGILARRILCWVKEKDEIQQGAKLGAILLGSQVNFEFPKKNYKLLVSKGQKVYAGVSIIAIRLKQNEK